MATTVPIVRMTTMIHKSTNDTMVQRLRTIRWYRGYERYNGTEEYEGFNGSERYDGLQRYRRLRGSRRYLIV